MRNDVFRPRRPKPLRAEPSAATPTPPLSDDLALLAMVALSDEFDAGTRLNAGRELVRLGYDLAYLRRRLEREGRLPKGVSGS